MIDFFNSSLCTAAEKTLGFAGAFFYYRDGNEDFEDNPANLSRCCGVKLELWQAFPQAGKCCGGSWASIPRWSWLICITPLTPWKMMMICSNLASLIEPFSPLLPHIKHLMCRVSNWIITVGEQGQGNTREGFLFQNPVLHCREPWINPTHKPRFCCVQQRGI